MLINPAPGVEAYERALKPAVVRWTMPGWMTQQMVSTAIVIGTIYYMPIFVPERTTYDRIGVYVNVGDGLGGLVDLRIYNWAGGLPDSQVLSAGTIASNAAGAQEIVINETLERGYYFLACRGDQVPQLNGREVTAVNKAPAAGLALTNLQGGINLCVPYVLAVMADPAPAPTGIYPSTHAFIRLREA